MADRKSLCLLKINYVMSVTHFSLMVYVVKSRFNKLSN
ncbi:hypothetical protein ABH916_002871 [Peribacillus frigoritolerans]